MSEALRSLVNEARHVLAEASKHGVVVAPNLPERKRVKWVAKEMEKKGPPRLRAYWNGKEWEAIEGSHRIAAAEQLGLRVIVLPVKIDQVFPNKDWESGGLLIGDSDKWKVSTREALDWFREWNPNRPKYRVEVEVGPRW
jgi:hypothetical protein